MKKNALYLGILFGLLHSCSKPKTPKVDPLPPNTGGIKVTVVSQDSTKTPIDSDCWVPPPLHPSNSDMSPYLYTKQPQYLYYTPRFNPLNSNEILYVLADRMSNTVTIIKYNLVTKSKTRLASNIWDRPDWSSKGWILFNHGDNTIWKIKDNGDSLTQLTTFFSFSPIWDKPGNRFACHAYQRSYIADEHGVILDTMMLPVYKGAWSPDNSKIASEMKPGTPGYIDLTNKQKHEFSGYGANSIPGLDWFPDSQTMLWCADQGGIYKTNIITGATTTLRKNCARKTYVFPSVSSDGSKIIVQASEINAILDTIFVESNLYIMDADGSNEHKLIID